ncbi:hypothetical protein IAR50_000019 [Cryptococcus sp. DSM 104548]
MASIAGPRGRPPVKPKTVPVIKAQEKEPEPSNKDIASSAADLLSRISSSAAEATRGERSRIPTEVTRIVSNYMDTTYRELESGNPDYYTADDARPSVQSMLVTHVTLELSDQVTERENLSLDGGDMGSVELVNVEFNFERTAAQKLTRLTVKGDVLGEGWSAEK